MHRIDLSQTPWKLRESGKSATFPAVVPGCVHTDLLKNKRIPDPFWGTNELDLQWIGQRDWEYSTTFSVPSDSLDEEHVELVAEGLDTISSVYINGKLLARTDNMFVAHRWDIRPFIKKSGNLLRIVFASAEHYIKRTRTEHNPPEFNDPVGRCTVIRKQQCQFGWDWGPRLVTAGIWRPIRVEAWSGNRIESVHISQQHADGEMVRLEVAPTLAVAGWSGIVCARLYFDGKLLAERQTETGALVFDIANPRLWWPAGQGEQPLYTVSVELVDRRSGEVLDQCQRRVGLRTLVLDRHADEWGESFQFVINGRPIFAKGANWIPAHSFVSGLKRADYERDLRAAVAANMNMIRVWGGGIYEHEAFYDLCDELGLLVWQDFMFACSLYPHDGAFLDSVRIEAEQQVRRLQHRVCLALWCGNNELPQINKPELRDPDARAGYEALFHQLLPDAVRRFDGATSYWPSSEWRGFFDSTHSDGEKSGDTHFWDVWHQRAPVKDYERWQFRFCSEFGMQSYPSLAQGRRI
jgi:beta-mannosidase